METTLRQPKLKPPKDPYASFPEAQIEEREQISPAMLSQKRQIDSDNEHQLKWAQLTRKNLAVFNKEEEGSQ